MPFKKGKAVLFNHRPSDQTVQSFLFHFAIHYSRQGRKVLYISPRQIDRLPPCINESTNENRFDPVAFQQIRFLYIQTREKLAEALVGSHSLPDPPTVLIVDQLDSFCSTESEASGIGALLMHTARVVGTKAGVEGVTIASQSQAILASAAHFKTVWSVLSLRDQVMLLNERSQMEQSGPTAFLFSRLPEGNLKLVKVMENSKLTLDSVKSDTDIDF